MAGEFLTTLTTVTNFAGLVVSLWLGFYIVTRSPRSQISWLASGTLWALTGYFLNNLTYVQGPPGSRLPWWWGWSVALAVPLWSHLSVTLLPEEAARRQRWWVPLVYLVTLNLVAMEAFTPWIFEGVTTEPSLYSSAQQPGPLYPLFVLYLIAVPLLSTYNLTLASRQARNPVIRKQLGLLAWAAALAVFAGAYNGAAVWLGLRAPLVISSLALAGGVGLLGYAVARYNALVEGRVLGVDLPYTALAMGLVVAAYLLAAWISNVIFGVPFMAFVFVLMLAVISHSLYDRGRSLLDTLFYRQRYRHLRSNLRDVVSQIQPDEDIGTALTPILETVCGALGAEAAFIAVRRGDAFTVTTQWGTPPGRESIAAELLAADEASLVTQPVADGALAGMEVIVPLQAAGESIGALVLGRRSSGAGYSDEDLVVLEECGDTLASVLHTAQLQAESVQQIEGLLRQLQQLEQQLQQQMRSALTAGETPLSLVGMEKKEAVALVEDALRRLYDYSYLGQHELAVLRAAERHMDVGKGAFVTHIDRGKALQRLLVAALEKLKPSGQRPSPATREWWPYVILHDCYVLGTQNRDVMSALYIGEGTFNRARRSALRAVTRAVAEMERQAQALPRA
jgi:hypothetical protein